MKIIISIQLIFSFCGWCASGEFIPRSYSYQHITFPAIKTIQSRAITKKAYSDDPQSYVPYSLSTKINVNQDLEHPPEMKMLQQLHQGVQGKSSYRPEKYNEKKMKEEGLLMVTKTMHEKEKNVNVSKDSSTKEMGKKNLSKVMIPTLDIYSEKLKKEESLQKDEPNYGFAYSVTDFHTGDVKSHREMRKNNVVVGSYSLIDPDGYKRIVDYTADDHRGFVATVRREPVNNKEYLFLIPKKHSSSMKNADMAVLRSGYHFNRIDH